MCAPFTHYGILKTPVLITKPGLLMVFGTNVPEVGQWGCLRVPTAPRTQEDSMNSAWPVFVLEMNTLNQYLIDLLSDIAYQNL